MAEIGIVLPMSALTLRNVLALCVMTTLSTVYYSTLASKVPQDWMLVVNFVLIPTMLGAVAYVIFSGKPSLRFALISLIPVLSIILVGGDPAKPGLELVLIGPLLILFWAGAGIAFGIKWFLMRMGGWGRRNETDGVGERH